MIFNCFKKKEEKFVNQIDLSKIKTIEELRDIIIILHQTTSMTQIPNIMKVNNKALEDFPSLKKLMNNCIQ